MRLVLILLVASFSISGVIRHDVLEKEYTELAKQAQFDCVGRINIIGDEGGGSFVLVKSNVILTAAHIFVESETRVDTIIFQRKQMIAFTPISENIADISKFTFLINNVEYRGIKLLLHPEYKLSDSKFDLALIELDKHVPDITPAVLNNKFNELNSKVVGVGYGASGIANKPETVKPQGKKIAGQNIVDSIGGYLTLNKASILYCDFDHPTNPQCNKMGEANPEPLEYIISGGDSGGGLFRNTNGNWELIGISAVAGIKNLEEFLKTGYYGQIMGFTRVSLFSDWIEKN